MKKFFFLIILLNVICVNCFCQTLNQYFISFKDKNASIYNINTPSAYLSQRAIDRRIKFNIPLTEQDFPINQNYLNTIKTFNVNVLGKSKWLNGVIIESDSVDFNLIKSLSFVKGSSQVYKIGRGRKSKSEEIDVANYTSKSTALYDSNYYGFGYPAIKQLHLASLHNQGFRGNNVLIAVMDAGFAGADNIVYFDSVFATNRMISTNHIRTQNAQTVYAESGHGTAVLSCMAGNIPNSFVGTAPAAKYALLTTEYEPQENIVEEYFWVIGAEHADSIGADIINSSLGYTLFDKPFQNHTYTTLNGKTAPASIAASIATRKGILICNSAGNDGGSLWQYIGVPADADSIISVGAVNDNNVRANFSSKGPTADGRIKPTLMALGASKHLINSAGNIVQSSGTSFSSPTLAGAVACLLQKYPLAKPFDIIASLKLSASYANTPDSLYGWGIPNFEMADYLLASNKSLNNLASKIFAVYNPYKNSVQVFLINKEKSNNATATIYNSTGALIAETKNMENTTNKILEFNLNTKITSGVYIIKVINANKQESLKFIF